MTPTSTAYEYVRCNLCRRDETEQLFLAEDTRSVEKNSFSIVQCKCCGLVYLNPRPVVDSIARYYPKGRYYTHRPYEGWRRRKERLTRLVRQSMPGYAEYTSPVQVFFGKCLGLILRQQMEIIVPFKPQARILDIGCGNGDMIAWMADYGWEVYGTDISPEACAEAARRGLRACCGLLENIGYVEKSFDVITLAHVLEHSHNPFGLLNECGRILTDDGQLIVAVPNFGCIDRELYGPHWWQIDAPRHLYQFTSHTLGALLDSAGFKVFRWKFKFLPLPFLDKASLGHAKSNRVGAIHRLRLATRGCLSKLMARKAHTSVDLVAYAVKRR
jgi:2-polyprenyl-3-methyl-5-hydroxy-6-metoxy-1,4-benzoquinol methylase